MTEQALRPNLCNVVKNLVLIGLAVCLGWGISRGQESSPHIKKIIIQRDNVFSDTSPQAKKFPFKLANKLHLVSREYVIRRELLFKEGEKLDSSMLAETERNLRRLEFLSDVVITSAGPSDSVDVIVRTQDLWTLSPSVSASGGGGKNSFYIGIDDENLLGRGQTLAFYYSQDNLDFFKEEYGGLFWERNLFSARIGLLVSINDLTHGHARLLRVERPFFSLAEGWAFNLQMAEYQDQAGFYLNGREVIRNQFKSQKVEASFGLAKGELKRSELELQYSYSFEKYRPVAYRTGLDTSQFPLVEENEKLGWLTLTFKAGNIHFGRSKNLDRYRRTEDLNLGWSTKLGIGRSAALLGSQSESWYFSPAGRFALQLSERQYLNLSAKSSAFWQEGDFRRVENGFYAAYFNQMLSQQTLVFGVRAFDYTRQLQNRQFILGGANGIRGFDANRFSGTKAVVVNLEDRIFSNLQILTFGMGGAVFIDGGQAWNRTGDINFPKDLRWSYGIGLRLGPTKAFANRVIRLDLARSFHSDSYYVSFGVGQVLGWEQPSIL